MDCNPIFSTEWQKECTEDWSSQLYAFFCVGFIWMCFTTLSIGGHIILRHLRTGEVINFSVVLGILESIGTSIIVAFFFLNVIMKGNTGISNHAVMCWISIPFYINEACVGFLTSFLYFVVQKKLQTMQTILTKSLSFSGFLCIFIVFPFVILGTPDSSDYSHFKLFSIPLLFTNSVLLCILALLVRAYTDTPYTSLVKTFVFMIIIRTGWCILMLVHIFMYEESIQKQGPALYFTLWGGEFIFLGLSGQISGAVGVSNEITDSALDCLKPTIEVEMCGATADNAVVKQIGGGGCKVCTVEIQINTAQELLWEKPLTSIWDLFVFPNPINEIEARVINLFACGYMTAIFLVHHFSGDATYIFIPSFVGWFLRALSGPKLEPHSWVALWICRKLELEPYYVAGPPKRVNQCIAFCFTFVSFLVYINGYREAALWLLSVLYVMVMLYVVYAICGTCSLFYVFILIGIFPEKWNKRTKFVPKKKSSLSRNKTSTNSFSQPTTSSEEKI